MPTSRRTGRRLRSGDSSSDSGSAGRACAGSGVDAEGVASGAGVGCTGSAVVAGRSTTITSLGGAGAGSGSCAQASRETASDTTTPTNGRMPRAYTERRARRSAQGSGYPRSSNSLTQRIGSGPGRSARLASLLLAGFLAGFLAGLLPLPLRLVLRERGCRNRFLRLRTRALPAKDLRRGRRHAGGGLFPGLLLFLGCHC